MNPHCKNCIYDHNAGHPKESNKGSAYNDWCTKISAVAHKVVGHCKLKDLRKLK